VQGGGAAVPEGGVGLSVGGKAGDGEVVPGGAGEEDAAVGLAGEGVPGARGRGDGAAGAEAVVERAVTLEAQDPARAASVVASTT
jgi:hypothetical protein